MPGLDGLRAVAVLAVLAYHLQLDWAQGGLLGVGVFFTLSGYLITDLLLAQRATIGRLRLGDFWLRRARRLLPALFLMLAAVAAWVTLLDSSQLPALRGDVVAAILYVSNWWNIFQRESYFANFGPPPPLDHLWSLAIEEQFYLLWPFMLWLGFRYVRGRYQLVGLTLAIAALSAAAMALLYHPGADPTRIYEGTDTRAFGLLVGAALAMVWPSRRLSSHLTPRDRWRVDGAGVAGLVVIVLLIWQTDQYSASLYRGGMVLLTMATALVVLAVAHPASWLGVALGWAPLRWIGARSYGIYLWHFPIIVLTSPNVHNGTGLALSFLQVAATIAVAALSWRFVEEPIRRGALERHWAQIRSGAWRPKAVPVQSWVTTLGVLSVLALASAGLSGSIGSGANDSSRVPQISEGAAAQQQPTDPAPTGAPAPTPERTPPTASVSAASPPPGSSEASSARGEPAARTSCEAVAYIGDSTSKGMTQSSYLPDPTRRLDAQYTRVGATSQHLEISGARSIVEILPGQSNGYEEARQLAKQGFRGCWMIALGTNDTANVYMGSPVGRMDRIERLMSVVGDQPVLWVNLKSLHESGPYSAANMELWNRTLVQACASYPNMRVFDWASLAEDSWFASDGLHYTSAGYAERARLTAASLVEAFPAPASGASTGCILA